MVLKIATPWRARNDMVIDGGSFFLGRAMVRGGRRGQCRTPYETDTKIPRFRRNGGFPSKLFEFHTPSGGCQIRTTPDHTSFTRVTTSNMSDSLAPGTAGRPVGKFYSSNLKHNLPVPNLPRAKPGTPSGN